MQPSILKTVLAPASPTTNPARLISATDVPLRVVLTASLIGPATAVAYAYSVTDLTPSVSSESFTGIDDLILILAPKQVLYAVGIAGTVAVSLAASEAYPVL